MKSFPFFPDPDPTLPHADLFLLLSDASQLLTFKIQIFISFLRFLCFNPWSADMGLCGTNFIDWQAIFPEVRLLCLLHLLEILGGGYLFLANPCLSSFRFKYLWFKIKYILLVTHHLIFNHHSQGMKRLVRSFHNNVNLDSDVFPRKNSGGYRRFSK